MDNGLLLTLWVASGAFIGGVVTPLFTASRRFNDWIAALVGLVVGGVGNIVALVPLWIVTRFLPASDDKRLLWQRDAISMAEVERQIARSEHVQAGPAALPGLDVLRENFWPKARTEGHSHRGTYVGVFVALVVVTVIEVAITVIGGGWITGPLVALSTLKVLLVAGFFMHLIYDSKWYAALFVFALPFAGLIMIVLALA